jgi:hypothetical protein
MGAFHLIQAAALAALIEWWGKAWPALPSSPPVASHARNWGTPWPAALADSHSGQHTARKMDFVRAVVDWQKAETMANPRIKLASPAIEIRAVQICGS